MTGKRNARLEKAKLAAAKKGGLTTLFAPGGLPPAWDAAVDEEDRTPEEDDSTIEPDEDHQYPTLSDRKRKRSEPEDGAETEQRQLYETRAQKRSRNHGNEQPTQLPLFTADFWEDHHTAQYGEHEDQEMEKQTEQATLKRGACM